MAGYNTASRGYTNDWNKPSYGESGYSDSDHLRRPVIVDAEGRKRPIISFNPIQSSESYVTGAERIVEQVRQPLVVTEYQYSSQAKVEPLKDYDKVRQHVVATEYQYSTQAKVEPLKDYDKWRRPSSPVRDRPILEVADYRYDAPTRVEAAKNYGAATNEENWRRPLSPVRDRQQHMVTDYGYSSPTGVEHVKNYGGPNDRGRWPSSPVRDRPEYGYSSPIKVEAPLNNDDARWRTPLSPVLDRPPKVEEFVSKVQTEASRPTRAPILSTTNWRNNIPNSTGQGGTTGYGGGEYARDDSSKDYYQRNDGQKGWTTQPGPLSGPTNDIGKAVEILKEAVKISSISTAAPPPQPRFTSPASAVPNRGTYTEAIDSKEAARRYGISNLSSKPPLQTGETYFGTIDSRTAAQKYKGTTV